MHIRTTLDPISLHEVPDPENHPCLYEGDGENGLEIYFENEENMNNDTDDYIAEG
jgi:hypothetical protein